MNIFRFGKKVGNRVTDHESNYLVSRIMQTNQPLQLQGIYLEEGGVIGYHKTETAQLLLVVSGRGSVKGKENKVYAVEEGEAVYWRKGEAKEASSETGLTAIAIEGEELDPFSFMPPGEK
ncbi:hypothetical protein [Salsuginibacillus kocurii]|uniref:hypothetical protein n=1 Tax=Salsuginibacillus kocurii TaxID=427078 RepID=UPI000382584D|nr:hypothetical protein [Salsuginibacillus kocurii]